MDDHLNNLYETDALIWTETQVALLRARKFDQLDLENIISELEYQVQKDKRSVASHLRGLMMHLLKYQFQPQRRTQSWNSTIIEHRHKILDALEDMPSLRPQVDEYVARNYPKAWKAAILETRLPPATFPQENPYTTDQILDMDFFPDQNEKAADP
jgi:hypothetical protein